jgi:O-antigen ligase
VQTEVAKNIEISEKRMSSFLLMYIAGMGLIPIFGVDFSAMSVSVFQLLIAFFLLRSKTLQAEVRPFLLQHKLFMIVFLLWLLLAVNAGLQSPLLESVSVKEIIISWTRLLYYLSTLMLGFAMYLFFRRVPLQQALLVKAMAFIMLAIILNMLLAYQLHPEFRVDTLWAKRPPLYSNIRHAGYHVCIVSIFVLFLLQRLVSWKEQVLLTTLLICFWAFNFWTGGRGSVLAALLGSFIFIAMLCWKGLAWKRVLLSLLLALGFGFVLAEFFVVFHWNSFLTAFRTTLDAPSVEQISAGRVKHWLHAIELIRENAFSGMGTGLYRFSDAHTPVSHPHNFVLQFAVDWGIPGALSAIFLLAGFFLKGLLQHVLMKDDVSVFSLCCGAVLLSLFALAMIDGTLYHTQPVFYFMVAMVFWMQTDISSKSGTESKKRFPEQMS